MTAPTPATPTRPVELTLTTELLSALTTRERALLPVLLAAALEMDDIFWREASGDRNTVLSAIHDPDIRSLVDFNYGPWDRRQGNAPLVPGVGPKPAGACFYPPDMEVSEFEAACAESPERAAALRSRHAVVRYFWSSTVGQFPAALYPLLDPGPLLRVQDVHVLHADGAAVGVTEHAEDVPQRHHRSPLNPSTGNFGPGPTGSARG